MRVSFRKLGNYPLAFEAKCDNAYFSGEIILKKSNLAQLNGTIQGSISIPCDVCAEMIDLPLDEAIDFYLSDGVFQGQEVDLDVIEIDNSMIDMDELLRSEIAMALS